MAKPNRAKPSKPARVTPIKPARGTLEGASKGASKPSERLAAIAGRSGKPKSGKTAGAQRGRLKPAKKLADIGARIMVDGVEQTGSQILRVEPTKMRVRTKFSVVSRQDLPTVVDGALIVRHRVTLDAVYEAEPIHNGLATIQGNRDNRVFGLGQPEARIDMMFESKAVADVFLSGRAFHVDFSDVAG